MMKYYPKAITLGQKIGIKFMVDKIHDRSAMSRGDVRSVVNNFVEVLKEQLLEGKTVNIEGLGVFMLSLRSKGEESEKEVTAKSVERVRIFFQANKDLRITKSATRAGEQLDLIRLEEYLDRTIGKLRPGAEGSEVSKEDASVDKELPESGKDHEGEDEGDVEDLV